MINTVNYSIVGLWRTVAGGNGTVASPGIESGTYYPIEFPSQVLDNNVTTKYTSFGVCNASLISQSPVCGINTGFQLTFLSDSPIVLAYRFCAANSLPTRDPLTVTIEGSNQTGSSLFLGSSWSLIYNGSTGLERDPGRFSCGTIQTLSNSIAYKNYRFLVTLKRGNGSAVQYSEVQLFV